MAILVLASYIFFYLPASRLRGVLVLIMLGIIGYALVATVAEMPTFGASANPPHNEVYQRYLHQAVEDTGAINAIAAIITDYRAFDTLGEVTVLFTAIAAALSNLKAH
ncbi:MAG: hypothetical protein GX767_08620 [Firmicutes bacterium]|nr:hypothetical protein [Bacillota bacterium]